LAQVKSGIQIYKDEIRPHIGHAVPYYPLGLPDITDLTSPICLGMRSSGSNFIAVWRLQGSEGVRIAVSSAQPKVLYPVDLGIQLQPADNAVTVIFPRRMMACILTL
jgi:alpha-galactosidase